MSKLASNLLDKLNDVEKNAQPGIKAQIREDECIGCTKCIKPCPTDAILGAGKVMHTVITDACTGCGLCVPTCPVDCIDLITTPLPSDAEQASNILHWQERHQHQQARLARNEIEQRNKHQTAKLTNKNKPTVSARQAAIQAAVARVHAKKEAS